MTKIQEARLAAAVATGNVINKPEFKPLWQGHAAVAQCVSELNALVETILATALAQASDTGGTEEKASTLVELADAAYEVAAAVRAYAVAQADSGLASRVNFSRWTILRGSQAEVITRCKAILAAAQEHVDDLEDYRIDATTLKALEKKIAAYEAVATKPREDRVASSTATASLPQLFGELSELLDERMDRLIFQFHKSAPAFYNEYFNARKRVGPATHPAEAAPAVAVPQIGSSPNSFAPDGTPALPKAA